MGELLVGVTLYLLDQVVTDLVPLWDHWQWRKTGEFQTAQEELAEVSWFWLYDWDVEGMSLGMNGEWTGEFQVVVELKNCGSPLGHGLKMEIAWQGGSDETKTWDTGCGCSIEVLVSATSDECHHATFCSLLFKEFGDFGMCCCTTMETDILSVGACGVGKA